MNTSLSRFGSSILYHVWFYRHGILTWGSIGMIFYLGARVLQMSKPARALSISIYLILVITLLGRTPKEIYTYITIRSTILSIIDGNSNVLLDIVLNIILFIPMGYYAFKINKKSILVVVCLGGCMSCIVELLQFVLYLGFSELMDIVTNTLGIFIGALIARKSYKSYKYI